MIDLGSFNAELLTTLQEKKDFSTSFLILGWFSSVCVPTYQVPQTPCFVYPLTARYLTAAPFSVCHIRALAHLIEREGGGMSPAR